MSTAVEHEKRKREILDKALDVFVDSGYEDTTFQKIAERCGITRTILYLYFKNKKEIFASSIKWFTEKIEAEINSVVAMPSVGATRKLVMVGEIVVTVCERESRLLAVILDYLGHLRLSGSDPDLRVRRRTIRMRHILTAIILEGKRSGEFSARLSVKGATELFYALIEAAVFRIAVLGKQNAHSLVDAMTVVAESLSASGPQPDTAPKAAAPAVSGESGASEVPGIPASTDAPGEKGLSGRGKRRSNLR